MSFEEPIAVPESADLPAGLPEEGTTAVRPISSVVSLMELAAARVMRPVLRAGESSVAVRMNVTHADAAALAVTDVHAVRAVASLEGVYGRQYHFSVRCFDESGLIVTAEHVRAVVNEKRVEGIARRRVGRASMLLNV